MDKFKIKITIKLKLKLNKTQICSLNNVKFTF